MLRFVSKFVVKRVLGFAAFAVVYGAVMAAAVKAEVLYSGSVGVDTWQSPAEPARYLPNYSLPKGKSWSDSNPWVRGSAKIAQDTGFGLLTLTAQGQTSKVYGGRVDRLDADLRLTPNSGVRLGVLPYRTAWCRAYDPANSWIGEPDAFCRFHGLNELAQGAFGVQAYTTGVIQGWLVDGMVGAYRPEIDRQSDKLGPYVAVGPNTHHNKFGAGLNGLHLPTGIQARLSWLQTVQDQNSDSGSYQRRVRYDTIYAAVEGNVTRPLALRASLSAYIGSQDNPASLYSFDGRSTTLEAIYKVSRTHTLAFGASRYVNLTTYVTKPHNQSLHVPSLSLSWRMNLPRDVYTVVQVTRSEDKAVSRSGVVTDREGTAVGIRLAKNF